jgi:addiction module HigA family antidote
MTMKNPPHPGGFIRRNIIDEHGLSVSAAADILGVARPTLSHLLNENADLSPNMALRIEKAFGVKMDFLLRLQLMFDVAKERKQSDSIQVAPYAPSPAH